MIKEFINAWNRNKHVLAGYFKTHNQSEYDSYEKIVKLIFDMVINPDIMINYGEYGYFESKFDISPAFDTDDILVIDNGNYQGTKIFVLHRKVSLPYLEDYIYTNTYYGSCSGCDTLMEINRYGEGLPSEEQIKKYMTLCLHLMEKCKFIGEEEE